MEKAILEEHSPEAILAAAKLLTQLPHFQVVDDELTPQYSLEERIRSILD